MTMTIRTAGSSILVLKLGNKCHSRASLQTRESGTHTVHHPVVDPCWSQVIGTGSLDINPASRFLESNKLNY
jgi:hypothetical protein